MVCFMFMNQNKDFWFFFQQICVDKKRISITNNYVSFLHIKHEVRVHLCTNSYFRHHETNKMIIFFIFFICQSLIKMVLVWNKGWGIALKKSNCFSRNEKGLKINCCEVDFFQKQKTKFACICTTNGLFWFNFSLKARWIELCFIYKSIGEEFLF